MKSTLFIKTILYCSTLLLGLMLTVVDLKADYVYPTDSSAIEVTTYAINQSFDEALLRGLQLLDQSKNIDRQFGIINIKLDECCIQARVKLDDLSKAETMTASLFIRKFVTFI